MEIIIGVGLAIGAAIVGWISYRSDTGRKLLGGLAAIAIFLASTVIATSATRTIMDNTVYMTEIHSVLESPTFIISTGYLMVYGLARVAAGIGRGVAAR
ncbi:hypothetical protein [Paenibacillus glycanilyticus]|uniref:Major facilitator superfamily (MFS) profile domain-containing protein n=1 Tax=Paenibacillus glycanilyticus TaxID=126569 RepID=A0ABQ6G9S7_9BACL|nr:hypothetical protein [Paenibacillus glycanilyticus]GLX67260.1 hypothetical protein MU1_16050 [Paenibacillus glycanilyticus]